MAMTNVDITIPVLNEERDLKSKVAELIEFLEENVTTQINWKIVIADNGSTDNTKPIGEEMAQSDERIQYLNVGERGVGLALKTSWGQSTADIVGYMDLDLATDLKHFPQVLDAIINQNQDFVYATRLHKQSKVVGRTLKREITSRVFNMIVKSYFGTSFSDGMCGFKFLKRNVFEALKKDALAFNGWFFSTEMLVLAEKKGFNLYELPVHWTDDSNSKVKIGSLSKQYLQNMKELKQHLKAKAI